LSQRFSCIKQVPLDFFLSILQYLGALCSTLLKYAESFEVQCGYLEAEEHFASEPSANRHPVHLLSRSAISIPSKCEPGMTKRSEKGSGKRKKQQKRTKIRTKIHFPQDKPLQK
jgi:hypothetical protein